MYLIAYILIALCEIIGNLCMYFIAYFLIAFRKIIGNMYTPPRFGTLGLDRPFAGQELKDV